MNKRNWLSRLEYKLGRFAIQNIMLAIVGTMAAVYLLDYVFISRVGRTLSSMLYFTRDAVMAGEVWRIFTFILVPPSANPIFIIFSLYLYWLYGSTLESTWGAFKFNLFYLCGMLGAVAVGFIFGVATNVYLNMSLFVAFALIYPEFELTLFFVLPIKVKYIAFGGLVLYAYYFIMGSWAYRAAIIVSFINLIIFFGGDFLALIKRIQRNRELKKRFKK